MRTTFVHPMRPSGGEKRLIAAALGVGTCGGLFSFAIVTMLGPDKAMLRVLTDADFWFVASGALGAVCALYLGRDWLGHRGWRGGFRMLAGIVSITFLGTIIGGTLALPVYGTMFGPMMFAVALAQYPLLALLWLNTLVATHLMFRNWRRERDSLFDPLPRQMISVAANRAKPKPTENWLTPALDRARRRA